jgi:DNA-binding YbaB/EbfC family protein
MAQDLANMTIEGAAGGGAVVITLTGDQQARAVKIDPDALDPEDVGALEDLVLAALKDALGKSAKAQEDAQQSVINAATGGLKLPPGFGF